MIPTPSSFLTRLLIPAMLLLTGIIVKAQGTADQGIPYPDYQEDIFMDLDFEPNLAQPEVPAAARKSIVAYQRHLADKYKDTYTVELMRDGEVVIVTVPTDNLFLPNDTLFSADASRELASLLNPMKNPYMFKIVIAVHTDDTGSESYRERLSEERIRTVYDWFLDEIDRGTISEDLVIVPYSMGSTMPLVSNDTRKHRRQNRRLEIYFVPGPEMIELAISGKLKWAN